MADGNVCEGCPHAGVMNCYHICENYCDLCSRARSTGQWFYLWCTEYAMKVRWDDPPCERYDPIYRKQS